MKIVVNGREEILDEKMNISELLHMKSLPAKGVVVEYNGDIIQSENFDQKQILPDARIEILRFVGEGVKNEK